ncbi:MAG: protein kinase [Polyangiales bacterium]
MARPEIDALVRIGELDRAASLARELGEWRRAAELFGSLGRAAEACLCAVRADDWRLAMDLALTSGDERVLAALADEAGKDPARAIAMAAQCRLQRRDDVAAMVLERSAPAEAAVGWYERGDYLRAARAWDRANDSLRAARAFEQHLAQTPDDAASAVRLAELRAVSGDDEGAVRALQAAVRADPTDEAMARLVCGLTRLGFEHGARTWVRRLRDRDPSHPAELTAYADRLPKSAGAEKRYAGRYRVIREVGSGATGRVLEAVDELSGEPVALKVLAVGDDRSAAFARFMREAELAKMLDDPTIVRMRALDPEGPTIVYDWMPGGTLAERVGRQSLREIRAVALRVLAALETLHRNGVVHRDLKPSNILFDAAGQARLGDLGAAHLGDLGATVTGGLVGSLPYMAPEQITGAPVSAATDLYALGCVLFQMLTGRAPYPGPDFVSQHLGAEPPSPSAVRAGIPVAFDAVIAAMLAKDPEARPQDVTAARALLATAPWDDTTELAPPAISRIPSLPAAAAEEGARLVPSTHQADAWTDQRLQRDVQRLLVPAEALETVKRWAATDATALQPVFDVLDEGARAEVWVQALDADTALDAVDARARGECLRALVAAGVAEEKARGLRVAWDGRDATVTLAEALRAMGVAAEVA